MDVEFNKVVLELPEVVMNTIAALEYVAEEEHRIGVELDKTLLIEFCNVSIVGFPKDVS